MTNKLTLANKQTSAWFDLPFLHKVGQSESLLKWLTECVAFHFRLRQAYVTHSGMYSNTSQNKSMFVQSAFHNSAWAILDEKSRISAEINPQWASLYGTLIPETRSLKLEFKFPDTWTITRQWVQIPDRKKRGSWIVNSDKTVFLSFSCLWGKFCPESTTSSLRLLAGSVRVCFSSCWSRFRPSGSWSCTRWSGGSTSGRCTTSRAR